MTHDIAIILCSRGREDLLSQLLDDLMTGFCPALEAGNMSAGVHVYAQAYSADYLAALEARFASAVAEGRLTLLRQQRPHKAIGDVHHAALSAVHERSEYRLAMLMDDDSRYRPAPDIDENLRRAARAFLANDARAFSIKLGPGRTLEFWPFVDPAGPVMPFKEKMMWVSRAVVTEALALPAFAGLQVGEDAVLAALAWRGGPEKCFGVLGIATFLHLAFEPDEEPTCAPLTGGYGALVEEVSGAHAHLEHGKYDAALRSNATPHHLLPDVFVGPDHPMFIYNGIRPEAVTRLGAERLGFKLLHIKG